jgi:DNA-binding LacI/PurR family transcriptional regulator
MRQRWILADSGRRVPEDFSIIAGSDSFWTPFVTPSLTAVSIDYAAIGRKATQLLLRMVIAGDKGTTPIRHIYPARIIERGSCRAISPQQ